MQGKPIGIRFGIYEYGRILSLEGLYIFILNMFEQSMQQQPYAKLYARK